MFEIFGSFLNIQLANIVAQMVSGTSTYLAPIVLAALTAWIINYGMNYMTGTAQVPVPAFAFKCAKMSLIFALALTAGNYMAYVYPAVNGVFNDFVTMVTTSMSAGGGCSAGDSFAQLDCVGRNLLDTASRLVNNSVESIGILDVLTRTIFFKLLAMGMGLILFMVGAALFLILAAYQIFVIRLNMTFLLALGPVFLVCLAFDSTKQYFWNWFGKLAYFCMLQALIFAYVALAIGMINNYLVRDVVAENMKTVGTLTSFPIAIIGAGLLMVVLALMFKQIDGLAATLTGGSPGGGGAAALGATMNKAAGAVAGAQIAKVAKGKLAGLGDQLKDGSITQQRHDKGAQRWQTVLDAVSKKRN